MNEIIQAFGAFTNMIGAHFGGAIGAASGALIEALRLWSDLWNRLTDEVNALSRRIDVLEEAAEDAADSDDDGYTYVDISSPTFAVTGDPGVDVAAVQNTAGTALGAIAQATGKTHLDVEVVNVQNTPGVTPATDYTVEVKPAISFNSSAGTYTITPRWVQTATAVNAVIAVVNTAAMHRATLRYKQR